MSTSILFAAALLLGAPPPGDWKVDADRGASQLFTYSATEGTWVSVDVSPDGKHIVFDLLGHLYEMPYSGGQAKALTKGRSWNIYPRYSPDGSHIAFTSDKAGSNDLWTLERKTGALKNISKMTIPVFQGTWSQDGSALYGTALNMKVRMPVYRFNLTGGRRQVLSPKSRNAAYHLQEHPTQPYVYFERKGRPLYRRGSAVKRLNRKTGKVTTYRKRNGGAASPIISRDGRHLAYVHRDDHDTILILHDLRSRKERVLARGLDRGRLEAGAIEGSTSNMAWHPGGKEIVVSKGGKIVAIDLKTGKARDIPFRAAVSRRMSKTVRFKGHIPQKRTRTLSHRWSIPTPKGIVYSALGDLYLLTKNGPQTLTQSTAHETNPVYDPKNRSVIYASWTDDELGGLYRIPLRGGRPTRLTTVPSQYGPVAVSPASKHVALIRGSADIRHGTRLEYQTRFELCVLDGSKRKARKIANIRWIRNRYSHRPPTVHFGPAGRWVYFTTYETGGDTLTLKRVHRDGRGLQTLYRFPNATRAVLSPDLKWIAFREYHRTFVSPFEFVGTPLSVSAADSKGFTKRVDRKMDGDFTEWNADSSGLYWTRGRFHVEKKLSAILSGSRSVKKTDLSFEFTIGTPKTTIALKNVRVLTLDKTRRVIEGATIVITGNTISAVGKSAPVPSGARVFDLKGRTVMPGMFDAHGHYGSPISALNVIEQRLYGLHANIAYGVTTMMDVYGTTQKDFWVSDMLRKGDIWGPRILSVGDPVFVTKYRTKMYRPITSLADALEVARFNKDHGAPALKDYSNHRRAARQQLIEACRRLGLNLVTESFGEPQMNLTQLVDGFTGIEHTMGLTPLYDDVVNFFAATRVGMTPTLIVVYNGPAGQNYFNQTERHWENKKLLQYYRRDELLRFRRPRHHFDDDFYHRDMAAQLLKLHKAGVLLQMGAHGNMMGLGAHWEMEMFVQGGFSPMDAIQVATINGYKHHGLDHQLGSIEPGKLADLVVLKKNPLKNIRNTRTVEYTIKNGTVYSGKDASRVYPNPQKARPMYFLAGQ